MSERQSKLTVRGGKLRALLPQPHARFRHLGLPVSRLLAVSRLARFVCGQRMLWSGSNAPFCGRVASGVARV